MLELLHALINPSLPLPADESEYHQMIRQRRFFQVSSQLYYLLRSQNRLDEVPLFFSEALKVDAGRNLMRSMMIKAELDHLLQCFTEEKIEVIPFKGTTFAEKYFGSLSARGTTDIDILVKPHQIAQATEILRKLGFTSPVPYAPEHFHIVLQKKLPELSTHVNVEVHWHFLRKGTSSLDMNTIWAGSSSLSGKRYIRELSDFHTFYLICLHGWNHDLDNWKYFIDIIRLIEVFQSTLNYQELFAFAEQQKTYKRIAHTLMIVYHVFPELERLVPLLLPTDSELWWNKVDLLLNEDSTRTFRMIVKKMKQCGDYETWQQKWNYLRMTILPDPVIMSATIGKNKSKLPRAVQYIFLFCHRLSGVIKSIPYIIKLQKKTR